jgi:hypothetical protein
MDANMAIDHRAEALTAPELEQLQGLCVDRRPAGFQIGGRRFNVRFRDGELDTGWLDVVIDERPRTMLMSIIEGPAKHKGKIAMCIYELEGQKLRWCPAEPGADDPPPDFPAVEGKRFLCTIFQRESPRIDSNDPETTPTLRSR